MALAGASACVPVGVTGQMGYAHMEVGGELALSAAVGANPSAINQGIDSAFGLGERQGSPYYRAQVDLGAPVVTASAFWLRESGDGQLANSFGGLLSGAAVNSRLDLTVAKVTAAYDFDLGVVKLSPGVQFDLFALDFDVREPAFGASEDIDDVVFVPMPCLRAEAGVLGATAALDLGYLEMSGSDGNDGQFFDMEAMVEWPLAPLAHLFVGYRYISIDGEGDTDTADFATDLQIQGWIIGGGFRF